jgi:putative peptidoglycan lipid II flippase
VPGAENHVPSFTQPSPSGAPGASLALVWRAGAPPNIRSFDPEGDGEENADEAPLAVDGDPSTSWRTDRYKGDPRFGRLKQGVGLLLDLGHPVSVREARIAVAAPGIALQVRAADSPGAAATDYTLVGQATATGTAITIKPARPTTARYWLVWVTKLAPDGGGYRANIAEIALLG